jgi:hypothetical protein
MKIHLINKKKDFIKCWFIKKSLCDDLINIFESSKKLHIPGCVAGGLKKKIKKSTDLIINLKDIADNKIYADYVSTLLEVVKKYIKLFPNISNKIDKWGITENFQIQRYYPKEGFYKWHCDRSTYSSVNRWLVYMTDLNDVKDNGETEWLYQKLKIKPKKGLTVLWPADWMYTHRGIPSNTETKYIITGWFSFIDENLTLKNKLSN